MTGEPDPRDALATGVDAAAFGIDSIVQRLRAAGASFAFVFGSRARGDHRDGSDLDIAAWWSHDPPRSWNIELPEGVQLVVLPGVPLELAGRIALEGRLLFDDDPPARVRWTSETRKIWLDERPRFERSHREFIEASARGG